MLQRFRSKVANRIAKRRKQKLIAQGGASADWYDEAYGGEVDEYLTHYSKSRYLPVWEAICSRLAVGVRVLEIGCGPGQFALMLQERGILSAYVGFDFSPQAIALARKNLPGHTLAVADARDTALVTAGEYDTVICTEVLEHIVDDTVVLARIPAGKQVLATVPDFDYESHVRFFGSEDEVRARYAPYFSSLEISTHHHSGDAGGHHGTFFLLNGMTN